MITIVIILLIISTKYFGKKPNPKSKSITIVHSSTTEAVRLPPDGETGVTVHPGVRSKLPLKRKVRNGKVRRKRRGKESTNNNLNSPNKSPKKKKRVSAPIAVEESRKKPIEMPHSKSKKEVHKIKRKKETINYSNVQNETDAKHLINREVIHNNLIPDTDPVGKVQNWLLKSQYNVPKSKSTPVGLTDKTRTGLQKRSTVKTRHNKSKSHSIGNIPSEKDKIRLQVIYKPPFKFSLKLRKQEKPNVSIEKSETTRRTGMLVCSNGQNDTEKVTHVKTFQPTKPQEDASENIDSNVHTVQSDLEVLLSESEFLVSSD